MLAMPCDGNRCGLIGRLASVVYYIVLFLACGYLYLFKFLLLGREKHFYWLAIAIVITLIISIGLAVGLYYKPRNAQPQVANGNANRAFQSQDPEKSNSILLKKIQNLTLRVQQLNQQAQEQNHTYSRRIQAQESQLQQYAQQLNETIQSNIILPEFGWYTPWNGYQYRLTESSETWQRIRRECQSYGGDLATFGMRNFNTRRFIKNALQDNALLWVGLSDLEEEGIWMWVDGKAANGSDVMWAGGQPSNSETMEHCAEIDQYYLTNDNRCSRQKYGICEKQLQ